MNNKNIVDDHKNMLALTKNISSFQEENLKKWPFIFFDGVESLKVSWDFFKNNKSRDFYAGVVNFDITLKTNEQVNQTAVDQLVASTKFLFWSETKVKIKINGKACQKK